MLPVSPGNIGTYEASVALAYHFLGLPPAEAVGLALAQHVCFLVPIVGGGAVVLLLRA
jgi:uncharacterized membrane protein YbhN (UPF0104 family)